MVNLAPQLTDFDGKLDEFKENISKFRKQT